MSLDVLKSLGANASGRKTYTVEQLVDQKLDPKFQGFVKVKTDDDNVWLIPGSHAKKAQKDSIFEVGSGVNGKGKLFLQGESRTTVTDNLTW